MLEGKFYSMYSIFASVRVTGSEEWRYEKNCAKFRISATSPTWPLPVSKEHFYYISSFNLTYMVWILTELGVEGVKKLNYNNFTGLKISHIFLLKIICARGILGKIIFAVKFIYFFHRIPNIFLPAQCSNLNFIFKG